MGIQPTPYTSTIRQTISIGGNSMDGTSAGYPGAFGTGMGLSQVNQVPLAGSRMVPVARLF